MCQAVLTKPTGWCEDTVVGGIGVRAVAVNGQEAMRGHPAVLTDHPHILAPRRPANKPRRANRGGLGRLPRVALLSQGSCRIDPEHVDEREAALRHLLAQGRAALLKQGRVDPAGGPRGALQVHVGR